MRASFVFHESYGELPSSLLRLIRKYNVSPSDYQELERRYGPEQFSAYRQAIQTYSKDGMFQPYLMWSGEAS